jgi:2-methylcitrate dehydratase PrpD
MLRALVLGYEIVTRVARSWMPRALVMQSHGRYAAVGAAAGICLAKKVSSELLIDAVSAACTLVGPSPRNHLAQGILVRNVWPAVGAWSGMMALEWAECGIAGAPGAFEDVYGTVLGGDAEPERLAEHLGRRWAILDGYTKIYACCQHLHSAVEAALELRNDLLQNAKLEDIASISVQTHTLALPLVNAKPHTTLAAKFSMSHAMAAALVTGSGGAQAFAASTLHQPAIARLRERVDVAPYFPEPPPPNDRPARVTIELENGGRIQAECLSARGGPDRPLPPEAVLEKMASLASPVYPRMLPMFEELMTLPARRMKQGWAELVTEMCA